MRRRDFEFARPRSAPDPLDRAIDDLKYAERLDPTSEANSHALEEANRLKRLGFNKVQVIEDLQLVGRREARRALYVATIMLPRWRRTGA